MARPEGWPIAKTQRPRAPGTGACSVPGRWPSRRAVEHEVGAAAGAQLEVGGQLARPHAGGVDAYAGANLEGLAGQGVVACAPSWPSASTRAAGEDAGAVGGSGPGDADDESRVVLELAVPRHERAAQAVAADRRGEPRGLGHRDAARAGQDADAGASGAAQDVAGDKAEPGQALGARIDGGQKGHDDRDRPDEVRRGAGEEDLALAGALVGDADRALGEVAQAAVDELGAPAAGAPGEVLALEQRNRQAARRGVESDARAGHPAADDKDVDDTSVAELGEFTVPARGVE